MNNIFIIAEAGVNHNGRMDLATQLIDAARDAGADAVKFQTFKADLLVSKTAEKADYQKALTDSWETQYEMLKRYELTDSMHRELIRYCDDRGIMFMSSAFDLEGIDYLNDLGLRIFKIPSGEIDNLPYLRRIGRLEKEVILSTGASELQEVETALKILEESGTPRNKTIVLHCNSEYPTPYEDVNLKAMLTIRDELGVRVGYSDHTMGAEVSVAAAALGASVIEKHITLDPNDTRGPDHKASLDPLEFAQMVGEIRNVVTALGDVNKRVTGSESANREIIRKSIVASRQIEKGDVFSEANITVKRPRGGLSPMQWDAVIGVEANKIYSPDEMIVL